MKAAVYSAMLTNYARGISQDMANAVARVLAPETIVSQAIGQYKKFSDKDGFKVVDTRRAIGGNARRLEINAEDPAYICTPNALEIPLDQYEEELSGSGQIQLMKQVKTKTLVSAAVLSREARVVELAKSVPVVSGVGNWSDDSKDPVKEIDKLIQEIATNTGMMPNNLVLGLSAWVLLRHNKNVIARFPGAAAVGVSTQQFASLLVNPQIKITIGVLSQLDASLDPAEKPEKKRNVLGGDAFVFISQDNPTEFDPSFMKTFATGKGGIDKVWTYQEPRAEILAVDWTEQIQVTSVICGKHIAVS